MVKYRLIIEYHKKGNNNTQVATLCGCSRMTVWKILNRIRDIEISIDELSKLDNEELKNIIFPEYMKKGVGFLIPDFKWEEFQMRKHQSSLRLCWRRYCKRALKQNLKAYSWASFVFFYGQFRKPCSDEDDPNDKVRNKLKRYNLMLSYCNPNGEQYQKLKKEKEEWLKSLCQTKIIRTLRKRRYLRAFLQILGRCTYSTTVLAFATNHRKYRRFCCRQV